MPNIAILGSTGSIGTQTLQVLNDLPDYQVFGISAHKNLGLLQEQIHKYKPNIAVINGKEDVHLLKKGVDIPIWVGEDGLCELASHPSVDVVVIALVGAAGLKPTLAALSAGKKVALANKESLVAGGHLVMKYDKQLIPIDSEHSALWQCLDGRNPDEVHSLILTASGGPFHTFAGDLSKVTVEAALKHPNWDMGGKITIDSATLMNKGLEVIEAHWLFGRDYEDIQVVIHPQSIIHSMVRFRDGSILAQMATTDMQLPIQYALTYPNMKTGSVPHLDLWNLPDLTFSKPDINRFPCLALAYKAGRVGGTLPTVMNAANEVAVAAFIQRQLGFSQIPNVIEEVMSKHKPIDNPSLSQILAYDQEARLMANDLCVRLKGRVIN